MRASSKGNIIWFFKKHITDILTKSSPKISSPEVPLRGAFPIDGKITLFFSFFC